MIVNIGEITYELIRGSDAQHEGMYLEVSVSRNEGR